MTVRAGVRRTEEEMDTVDRCDCDGQVSEGQRKRWTQWTGVTVRTAVRTDNRQV